MTHSLVSTVRPAGSVTAPDRPRKPRTAIVA